MWGPERTSLLRRAFVLAPVLLALAACSTSGGLFKAGGNGKAVTPTSENVGTGSSAVAILAADEAHNLSDGAAGSTYLAARLATTALSGTPIRLLVRRYDGKSGSLQKAATEFAQSGAKLVIAPADDAAARALANALAPRGVSVVSLGQSGDPANRLFGAFARRDEVTFSAAEMKRRGYGAVAIVQTTDAASAAYANDIGEAAARAGLKVQFVDGGNPAAAAAQLQSQAAMGFEPRAIVFATGPAVAAGVMGAVRAVPDLQGVAVVGNGGWAVAPPAGLGKGWYPSLSRQGLAGFVEKFTAAYGQRPTVEAAVAYDLVVLGGALPQVAPDDPFGTTTMTNAQGFAGVTGNFRFDAGGVARRAFSVVELR
ncbi:hypothetical protein [Paradevosia shaoguanensis]|uniref:hypothetical protein n=1 Tax=Paradevosia shaoguanensis TaxID=1335043 RepID=UPI00193198C6|nr:hypothetical protein [Paradevosia shaoguanensis]